MVGEHKPGLRFADKRRGEAALTLLSGELWVCFRHPDGQFVTERKATEADLVTVGDLLRSATARIQALVRALRWLVNLLHCTGKAGRGPETGEWTDAIEEGECALAGEVGKHYAKDADGHVIGPIQSRDTDA